MKTILIAVLLAACAGTSLTTAATLNPAATGDAPVSQAETLEIYAFMEAADESKRHGGAPVLLETVLQKARAQIGGSTK